MRILQTLVVALTTNVNTAYAHDPQLIGLKVCIHGAELSDI